MFDFFLHIFNFNWQFYLKEPIKEENKSGLRNIVQLNCKSSVKVPVFVHV